MWSSWYFNEINLLIIEKERKIKEKKEIKEKIKQTGKEGIDEDVMKDIEIDLNKEEQEFGQLINLLL